MRSHRGYGLYHIQDILAIVDKDRIRIMATVHKKSMMAYGVLLAGRIFANLAFASPTPASRHLLVHNRQNATKPAAMWFYFIHIAGHVLF